MGVGRVEVDVADKLSVSNSEVDTEIIPDIACTRCGCVCDDLVVSVKQRRVIAAQGACELAESWFLQQNEHEPGG